LLVRFSFDPRRMRRSAGLALFFRKARLEVSLVDPRRMRRSVGLALFFRKAPLEGVYRWAGLDTPTVRRGARSARGRAAAPQA